MDNVPSESQEDIVCRLGTTIKLPTATDIETGEKCKAVVNQQKPSNPS